MKTSGIFMLTTLLCFLASNCFAQNSLTEEQKQIFKDRVKQKVEEFQNGLSTMVDDHLRADVRKEAVYNVLKLFIGEGEPYDYYDEEREQRIHSSGVKIQTSYANRSTTRLQKLKSYLFKLYNPQTGKSSMSYSEIAIESVSAVRVNNIVRVGDHYECVAYLTQNFYGHRDGKVYYNDMSVKKIRFHCTCIVLPDGQKNYDVKLGDLVVHDSARVYY